MLQQSRYIIEGVSTQLLPFSGSRVAADAPVLLQRMQTSQSMGVFRSDLPAAERHRGAEAQQRYALTPHASLVPLAA